MDRMNELALKVADALDDGRDPFSAAFLNENEITADEFVMLTNMMANALREYV